MTDESTPFVCEVNVIGRPSCGQVAFLVGPVDMGNLVELLDYLRSETFREKMLDAAAETLTDRTDMEGL